MTTPRNLPRLRRKCQTRQSSEAKEKLRSANTINIFSGQSHRADNKREADFFAHIMSPFGNSKRSTSGSDFCSQKYANAKEIISFLALEIVSEAAVTLGSPLVRTEIGLRVELIGYWARHLSFATVRSYGSWDRSLN